MQIEVLLFWTTLNLLGFPKEASLSARLEQMLLTTNIKLTITAIILELSN